MKHILFYLAMILLPVLGLVSKNNAQVKGNKPYELSCFRITEERINLPPMGFQDTPRVKPLAGVRISYASPRYFWQGKVYYYTYSGDTSGQVFDTANFYIELEDKKRLSGFRVIHYFHLDYSNVERHNWGGEDHKRVYYYDEQWHPLPDSSVKAIEKRLLSRKSGELGMLTIGTAPHRPPMMQIIPTGFFITDSSRIVAERDTSGNWKIKDPARALEVFYQTFIKDKYKNYGTK